MSCSLAHGSRVIISFWWFAKRDGGQVVIKTRGKFLYPILSFRDTGPRFWKKTFHFVVVRYFRDPIFRKIFQVGGKSKVSRILWTKTEEREIDLNSFDERPSVESSNSILYRSLLYLSVYLFSFFFFFLSSLANRDIRLSNIFSTLSFTTIRSLDGVKSISKRRAIVGQFNDSHRLTTRWSSLPSRIAMFKGGKNKGRGRG